MTAAPRYFDRELSWLEFNTRVLNEARSPAQPLLERVKFLAITGSNLDEFIRVRVGSLVLRLEQAEADVDPAAERIRHELSQLRESLHRFCEQQDDVWLNALRPELASQDIRLLEGDELNAEQIDYLRRQFAERIEPVLAPIGVGGESEFPMLAGGPLCALVRLGVGSPLLPSPAVRVGEGETPIEPLAARYAVIPLDRSLPRLWTLPSAAGTHFVLLETVVGLFVAQLLAGQTVEEYVVFRASRNAELEFDDDAVGDRLQELEQMLAARKSSQCVRLEIAAGAGEAPSAFLAHALGIAAEGIHRCHGPIDLSALMRLAELQGRAALRDEPWPPHRSPAFPSGGDLFALIAEDDRLLCHPYQSFDPVVELLRAAAADPDVLAIKQTLYRTSSQSAIVAALAAAAKSGKSVTAIVELRARFDEARNIGWARQLEIAGVDVVYGLRGLKVHAKMTLVVRREVDGVRRYLHVGTGNYNESTARIYSDLSFFTCNPQLGDDAVRFFNAIAGFSAPLPLGKFVMAPIGLRERLLELIDVETTAARGGDAAGIDLKVNSLVDTQIIDALYEASQAGVPIRLNVRGICCLRPGVPGLSESIQVVSLVDRFLEHARVFRFHHRGDDLVLIGSADLMPRNLDRRVELLVQIDDPSCKAELIEFLECHLADNSVAYELRADGSYRRRTPRRGANRHRAQEELYHRYGKLYQERANPQAEVFRPIRGEHPT